MELTTHTFICQIWSYLEWIYHTSNVQPQSAAVLPSLWGCGWRSTQTAGFQADRWWRWGCRGWWTVASGRWRCSAQLLHSWSWGTESSSGASLLHLVAKENDQEIQNELQAWCRVFGGSLTLISCCDCGLVVCFHSLAGNRKSSDLWRGNLHRQHRQHLQKPENLCCHTCLITNQSPATFESTCFQAAVKPQLLCFTAERSLKFSTDVCEPWATKFIIIVKHFQTCSDYQRHQNIGGVLIILHKHTVTNYSYFWKDVTQPESEL